MTTLKQAKKEIDLLRRTLTVVTDWERMYDLDVNFGSLPSVEIRFNEKGKEYGRNMGTLQVQPDWDKLSVGGIAGYKEVPVTKTNIDNIPKLLRSVGL